MLLESASVQTQVFSAGSLPKFAVAGATKPLAEKLGLHAALAVAGSTRAAAREIRLKDEVVKARRMIGPFRLAHRWQPKRSRWF